jgi:hypothetical protein
MLSLLRFLAMVVFGFLTVVFGIMGLISSFRYTKYGSLTKKTIRVSAMYLALCIISLTLFVIILDPTKTLAMFVGLVIGLSAVAFYVGASYFNLTLVEKGPRKMFAPVWQFLKRLFTRRNSD